MAVSNQCKFSVAAMIGALFVASGLGLIFFLKSFIRKELEKMMPIGNNSFIFDKWKSPPVDITVKFYLWSVRNPQEIIKGAKPVLKIVGPYTYKETRDKKDITFHYDGKISYIAPRYYYFDRDRSVGPENGSFVLLHFVGVAALHKIRFWPSSVKYWVCELLRLFGEATLFKKMTVRESIWGYQVPVLKLINDIYKHIMNTSKPLIDDKVGPMYSNDHLPTPFGNGTADGRYTIFSGKTNISKLNIIDRWNGIKSLPHWATTYANMINGTDGLMFPPLIGKNEELYVYSTEMSRSIRFSFEAEKQIEGINLLRYVVDKNVLRNVKKNPNNIGFCTPTCFGDGVLNISGPLQGVPVTASLPHFYQGSQEYIDQFRGIHPSSAHSSFLDIEPYSGVSMRARKQLQFNLVISRNQFLRGSEHLDKTIFPYIIINETAEVSTKLANEFKNQFLYYVQAADVVQWGLIGTGIFIWFLCFVFFVRKRMRPEVKDDEATEPMLPPETEERITTNE